MQEMNNYSFTSGLLYSCSIASMGFFFLLLGSLMFAANIFVMTIEMETRIGEEFYRRPETSVGSERGEIMNCGCRIFVISFVALGLSWGGFVLCASHPAWHRRNIRTAVLNSSR